MLATLLLGSALAMSPASFPERLPGNTIMSLAISSKTNTLFIGGSDGTVRGVDLKTLQLRTCYQIPGTYIPLDTATSSGSNYINCLSLSPDENELVAVREGRKGNFCIQWFDLRSGSYKLIPHTDLTVPSFSEDNLYYEAAPSDKTLWAIQEWSRSSQQGKLISDKKSSCQAMYYTSEGIVCHEFSQLRLYPFNGSTPRDIPLPNGFAGWNQLREDTCMDASGRYAMADMAGNLYYAKSLFAKPTKIGVADPSLVPQSSSESYCGYLRFVGADKLVTGGFGHKLVGQQMRQITGVCSVWNLKDGTSRSFPVHKACCTSIAASESIVAVGYRPDNGESGRVDLFDFASGKLLATLISPYSYEVEQVRVNAKRY